MAKKTEGEKKKRRGHGEGTVYYREDRKQWWAQVTIEGKRRTLTGKSEKEVVAKKKALEAELARGTYAQPSKVTLEAWLKRWLEVWVKPLEDTTYEQYETQVRVHISPVLGKRPIQQLRPSDIKSFLNTKQKGGRADGKKGGLSLRTIHLIRFILRKALKQAIQEGIVSKNVAEDVALPTQPKRQAIYLGTKDLELFTAVAGKSRHFAAIMTEIGTGLRRGELLGLMWDCLDLVKGIITVRRQLVRTRAGAIIKEKPKTPAGYRTIDLPDEVVTILKRHRVAQAKERLICGQLYENNNLVFAQANGRRIEPRNFTAQVDKMLVKAKIKHVPFHSLRHSHATELLRMGVDLAVIGERLGHSSYQVTREFYAHIAPELKQDAAEKINTVLTAGRKKKPSRLTLKNKVCRHFADIRAKKKGSRNPGSLGGRGRD